MKHSFRFLADLQEKKQNSYLWSLKESKVFHFQKVLRLKLTAKVEVFDGKGTSACGTVLSVSSKEVLVETFELKKEGRQLPLLCLALAVFRQASFEDILSELVELGVDKIFCFQKYLDDVHQFLACFRKVWVTLLLFPVI